MLDFAVDQAREPFCGADKQALWRKDDPAAAEVINDVIAYDLDQAVEYVTHRMGAPPQPDQAAARCALR